MERREWVKLQVFLAANAPVGALIRTGSDRLAHLTLWDTERDQFTPGQWLRARVEPATADISPDGSLLVYEAYDPRKKRQAQAAETLGREEYDRSHWTAISRPPYWTALDMWFHTDAQNGGGQFASDDELLLFPELETAEKRPDQGPNPLSLTPTTVDEASFARLWLQRKVRDGWRILHDPRPKVRKMEGMAADLLLAKFRQILDRSEQVMLLAKIGPESAAVMCAYATEDGFTWKSYGVGSWESPKVKPFVRGWIDLDQQGRLVWCDEGCLYAWGEGEPDLLFDARDMAFEPISSPDWAKEWPE